MIQEEEENIGGIATQLASFTQGGGQDDDFNCDFLAFGDGSLMAGATGDGHFAFDSSMVGASGGNFGFGDGSTAGAEGGNNGIAPFDFGASPTNNKGSNENFSFF